MLCEARPSYGSSRELGGLLLLISNPIEYFSTHTNIRVWTDRNILESSQNIFFLYLTRIEQYRKALDHHHEKTQCLHALFTSRALSTRCTVVIQNQSRALRTMLLEQTSLPAAAYSNSLIIDLKLAQIHAGCLDDVPLRQRSCDIRHDLLPLSLRELQEPPPDIILHI